MKISTLKKALPALFEVGLTPYIVGQNGVGKTQSYRQYASENNIGLVEINLNELDSMGDLLGLQYIDPKTNKFHFTKPDWWPEEGTKGLIVLDELSRVPTHLRQGIMRFIHEKKLHSHKLPDGWMVACAGNPSTDDFVTTDFDDKAAYDRMCFIKFSPTKDEWLEYARVKGMHQTLLMFLTDNKKFIEYDAQDFDLKALPSRRTHLEYTDKLFKILEHDHETLREVLLGTIGVEATIAFMEYVKNPFRIISPEEVALNYPGVQQLIKDNKSNAYLKLLMLNVRDYIREGKQFNKNYVMDFLFDIPKDLAFLFAKETYNKTDEANKNFIPLHEDKQLFNYFNTKERKEIVNGIKKIVEEIKTKQEGA